MVKCFDDTLNSNSFKVVNYVMSTVILQTSLKDSLAYSVKMYWNLEHVLE